MKPEDYSGTPGCLAWRAILRGRRKHTRPSDRVIADIPRIAKADPVMADKICFLVWLADGRPGEGYRPPDSVSRHRRHIDRQRSKRRAERRSARW